MRLKTVLVWSTFVLLLLMGAAWSFYAVFIKAPAELANATAKGIHEFLNFTPRVSIDQTVVIEANTPIMEVATVSRQLMVDHSWSHTWIGSTKSIHIVGTFTVKAGFDLKEPFTIDIEKNPLRVKATMPAPRILSISMDSYKIVSDESGWWNRLTNADRESGVRNLQAAARVQAESSGILEEVKSSAEGRIRQIVERNGATIEFVRPSGGE